MRTFVGLVFCACHLAKISHNRSGCILDTVIVTIRCAWTVPVGVPEMRV